MAEEALDIVKDTCVCGKESNAEDGDCDDLVRLECRLCGMHLLHEACLQKYMKAILHNVDLLKGPGHVVHNFNCPYTSCSGRVKKIAYLKGHRKNSKKKEARIQGAILASQVAQQSRRGGGAPSKQQQQQQQQQQKQQQQQQQQLQQKQQLKNALSAAAPPKPTATQALTPSKKPKVAGPSRHGPAPKILPDALHGTNTQKQLTSAQVKSLEAMREAKLKARAALGIQVNDSSGSSSNGKSPPLPGPALAPAASERAPTVLRSNGSALSPSPAAQAHGRLPAVMPSQPTAAQGHGRPNNDANVWGLHALRAAGLAPPGRAVDEQGQQQEAIPGAFFVEVASKRSKAQKRKEARALLQEEQQQQQQQQQMEPGPDALPATRDQEDLWITDPSKYKQRLRSMGVEWEDEEEEEDEEEDEQDEEGREQLPAPGVWVVREDGGEGDHAGVEEGAEGGWEGGAGQDPWEIAAEAGAVQDPWDNAAGGWNGSLESEGWDMGGTRFGEGFGERGAAAAQEEATAEEDHEGLLRAAWLEENDGIDAQGVLWFQDGNDWVTAHPDGRMEVMSGPPPLSAFAPAENDGLADLQHQSQEELSQDETVGYDVDAHGWQVLPQASPSPEVQQLQQQQQQPSQPPTTPLPWQLPPPNYANNHQLHVELLLQQHQQQQLQQQQLQQQQQQRLQQQQQQQQQQQRQQELQGQLPALLPTTAAQPQPLYPAPMHFVAPTLKVQASPTAFIPTTTTTAHARPCEPFGQDAHAYNTTAPAAPQECSPGALDQGEVDELMSLLCV